MGYFAWLLLMYQSDAIGEDGFCVFVFQHGLKIGLQRYDKSKTFLHLHLYYRNTIHYEKTIIPFIDGDAVHEWLRPECHRPVSWGRDDTP